jgi:hypothetical protein
MSFLGSTRKLWAGFNNSRTFFELHEVFHPHDGQSSKIALSAREMLADGSAYGLPLAGAGQPTGTPPRALYIPTAPQPASSLHL